MKLSKYLKKLIKIIFYFLSPIIILVQLVIYPLIKIRYSFQSSERLGEIAVQMEIYLSENNLNRKKNYFDVFILTDIISNKTYIDLLKKKILILPNIITFPIYRVIVILGNNFKFFNKLLLKTKYEDCNFSLLRSNINLNPDSSFILKGENFLRSIGVPVNSKIICLIVRDEEYLKKKFSNKNFQYHNYRNCNIENFKNAINSATKRGYYVFRMGEFVKKELKIDNNMYIEYSTKYRTDFLDVFLAYKCNFCITTSTGWDSLPSFTFRKPVVWTNFSPVGNLLTYSPDFLFSFKIHQNSITKEKLNLKKISESHASYSFDSKFYKDSNIELLENTPQEIEDLTIEMIDKLEGQIVYTREDEDLQNVFWKKYVEYFNLEKIKSNLPYKINPLMCTSQRLYNNKIISRVGKNFLKENIFLIN